MPLQGIDDFKRALQDLKVDLRKRVVRSAMRAALKPMLATAKREAPELQKPHPYRIKGLVKSRIVITNSRIAARRGDLGVFMKPRAVKGVTKGARSPLDPYYYRFVADGFHATGGRRVKGGRFTRKANLAAQAKTGRARFIPGNDFLGKAFRAHGTEAIAIFQQKLKARIDAANRRK